MLTRVDLQKFAPRPSSGERAANWDAYAKALEENAGALCAEFGIDTALELQHFMAQIAHESGGFTILWESGAYSAQGIMNTFGVGVHSSRVTKSEADDIANMPIAKRGPALFERVYGLGIPHCCKDPDNCRNQKQVCKARELGNNQPGDGFKFRGFGLIQVTGRKAHAEYIQGDYSALGALRAALREWTKEGRDGRDCNDMARADDVKAITKRINGGYNGFADRKRYLAKAKQIWPLFPGSDGPAISKTEIVQVSTKAQAANVAANIGKTTVAVAVAAETAQPLATATEHLTAINGFTAALATFATFVKSHALLGIIIIGLLLWWFGRHIIAKIIADFKSGRYLPSKGAPQ